MLHSTYEKVISLFRGHQGYMSFAELRENKITAPQMRELEETGTLERIARGWYWCDADGTGKPENYRYVELGLVLPEAIICGPSACYLHGILREEPETVTYLTGYESRRKVLFAFPTQKFYLDVKELQSEQTLCHASEGYRYLALEEAVQDCIHRRNRIDTEVYGQIMEWCRAQEDQRMQRLMAYRTRLRDV